MRSTQVDPREGVTLVELLVVLAIIGLTAGVAGVAVAALRPPPESHLAGAIRRTRATAIRTGVPLMVWIELAEPARPPALFRFLPDGRVLGPRVDPWTGTLAAPGGASAR